MSIFKLYNVVAKGLKKYVYEAIIIVRVDKIHFIIITNSLHNNY